MNATAVNEQAATRLSPLELRRRWQQMLRDPMLANIPGKIELNEKGTIELSPPNTPHSVFQAFVASELRRLRSDGTPMTECAIETDAGIRVPDVAWGSAKFMKRHGATSPLPRAPELCVEVLSPSNTEPEMQQKIAAYLAAGAVEVWLVKEDGSTEILTATGRMNTSSLGFALEPLPR